MKPGAVESDEVWSCTACRCVTTESWDIEAGAVARYERHRVTCTQAPIQVLNPPGEHLVVKSHPDWCRAFTIRL